jgi:hypothetical protein
MSLVFNAKTYNADLFGVDAVGYVGAAKTLSIKDDLQLSRVAPKPTTVFSGVGRTLAKLTRTLNLTGAVTPTGLVICSIGISAPVGAVAADLDSVVNDMAALMALASFKTHVKSQLISF